MQPTFSFCDKSALHPVYSVSSKKMWEAAHSNVYTFSSLVVDSGWGRGLFLCTSRGAGSSVLLRMMGVARGDKSNGNFKTKKKYIKKRCNRKANNVISRPLWNRKYLLIVIFSSFFEVVVKWTCKFIEESNLLAILQKASRCGCLVCNERKSLTRKLTNYSDNNYNRDYQQLWHCHFLLGQTSVSSHACVYGQPSDLHL